MTSRYEDVPEKHVPEPREPGMPELEVDETVPPRPEEDIADVARAKPEIDSHSQQGRPSPPEDSDRPRERVRMKRARRMRCCFCGEEPEDEEYIEIRLTVAGDGRSFQLFGAHRSHMQASLASGFEIELPEPGPFEDDLVR